MILPKHAGMVNRAWLGLFIVLWLLVLASAVYDAYYPTFYFPGFSPTPGSLLSNPSYDATLVIGSLMGAGLFTVILRVVYVGLRNLFR